MTDKYLTLVNAEHPIFRPIDRRELIRVSEDYPDILMERRAAAALRRLLSEIGSDGEIVPVSGWRSNEEQKQIWADTVAEKGVSFARKYVALPACSEHETGLAIDLALKAPEIDFICPDFPQTGICGKFRERAPYYGFIQRYSREKEGITGISEEPWHFRYVGTPHSLIMVKNGLSLEEYTDRMRKSGRRTLTYRGRMIGKSEAVR